jgi:hypothetical protein
MHVRFMVTPESTWWNLIAVSSLLIISPWNVRRKWKKSLINCHCVSVPFLPVFSLFLILRWFSEPHGFPCFLNTILASNFSCSRIILLMGAGHPCHALEVLWLFLLQFRAPLSSLHVSVPTANPTGACPGHWAQSLHPDKVYLSWSQAAGRVPRLNLEALESPTSTSKVCWPKEI